MATNTQCSQGLCEQCAAQGLPILPVRYTVVPKNVNPALPGWAGGHRVTDVALGGDFHYALRTMREGYIYLFYSKNARGSNRWECYTVGQDGTLIRQPDPKMARPQATPEFSCCRSGHNPLGVHYLVIDQPHKCGPTWIAFSETKWSDETLQEYTTNTKLRNARMQTFHPAPMVGGAKHSHGSPASQAALEGVIEYAPGFKEAELPYGANAQPFTKEDGSYSTLKLQAMSTLYPWHLRQGKAEATVKHMTERGKSAKGDATPHVLALWDAIGIAHELNGFRNDAAGWIDKYGHERELQISAYQAIEGLKQALANKAENSVVNAAHIYQTGSAGAAALRKMAVEKNDPRYAEAADLHEQWDAQETPSYYGRRLNTILQHYPKNVWRSEVDKLKNEVSQYEAAHGAQRRQTLQDKIQTARTHSWDHYAPRIDPTAQTGFKQKWDTFLNDADQIVDHRTVSLVHWLEASLFIDTLEDFHPTNVQDGVIFQDAVGDALFGIGSSKSGAEKLDQWVKEAKASVKTNLLWRAIALNQTESIADVDAALQQAEQYKGQRTVATVSNVEGIIAKTLKVFADTHKKTAGLYTSNTSAASEKGSTAFGVRLKPVKTRGVDKLAMTVGEAVTRFFRVDGPAEYLSEKIIQHMFSIRAFVEPVDSLKLIAAQAKEAGLAREEILKRLRTAHAFLGSDHPEMKTSVQTAALREQWKHFKNTNSKAPEAIRDARLALVIMLIEGLNFQKLLLDCRTKNDAKSWLSLAASGMTLGSYLMDIASVPMKHLFTAESWNYQRLKLAGGMLSAGATFIGVILDWEAAAKASEQGQNVLRRAYLLKFGLGLANLGLTAASTFTYAAPLIRRLTGSAVIETAATVVGERAAAVIGMRILFMSAGAWITVGVFTIQVFIWVFTDDDLQIWCDHCAFGKKQDKQWTAKKQYDELQEALKSVGV